MPTIVGISTFISMINTTSVRLKARNFFICRCFSFYEQLKFCAQLSGEHEKNVITSGPGGFTLCSCSESLSLRCLGLFCDL